MFNMAVFDIVNNGKRGLIMDKIFHPVTGETGYFCTSQEKELIDVVFQDFENRHLVVTSPSGEGKHE